MRARGCDDPVGHGRFVTVVVGGHVRTDIAWRYIPAYSIAAKSALEAWKLSVEGSSR